MEERTVPERESRKPGVRLCSTSMTLRPLACFLVGAAFAVIDAVTTWYALRFTNLLEGNPAARWAFERFGVTQTLTLRVLIGCAALGIVAWGMGARLGPDERLFNVGCRVLLGGTLILWGIVAVSNSAQILYVHLTWRA